MALKNSIFKRFVCILTVFNIAVCCILNNIFTANASTNDIVGYWVSQEDHTALDYGEIVSIKLYKLEITSVKNNRVSGVFIRNSTHFRDYGWKHTFVNAPINNNSFTLNVTDIWTVPLTDENSSPTAEDECTYIFTIQDNSINVKNSEGVYAENTLVSYTKQKYNSVNTDQKNESYKDYSDDYVQTVENVYEEKEADISFNADELEAVTDSEGAVDLLKTTLRGLSGDEIASVSAKDQLAYLAEETAARSATVQVEDADIVIDDESAEAAIGTVSGVVDRAESILNNTGVSVRSVRSKVRYSTSKESSVSISKENLSTDVDVVEAVTPFGSFEFEPDSVSELTVDSEGKNSISVSFDKNDTTSKVTVKFPDITSDGYKAVVDEEGNVVGGKYNPVTDELSAKIDESGVFTVVTNEKDFADIKSQPEEIQNAIKKLASKGIIKGTSETEFSPDTPITRAEIAALVVRILGVDDPNADGGFSDVTKENWYFGSAGSAKRENIIKGYEDNTFRGTVVIPKVQITSITARVLTNRLGYFSADESLLSEFTDADAIADWARGEVALAAYANMVIRRTDGSFAPDMEMTRGDAAVILEKLFDKVW